jgi:hypothetical protein
VLALVFAVAAAAPGPVLEHSGVACMVAERYPQLDARAADPDAVARMRIQFKGEGGTAWYFVDMKRSGPVFSGVLPKPSKSLSRVVYYIEASDRDFRETRTQEFAAAVVPEPGMCADPKTMAGALSAASVIVGGPSGAAAVPLGFSGAGVTSASAAGTAGAAAGTSGAGGGVGIGAIAAIGAGAAAAGAAVAVSQGGGDDGPSSGGAPSTTTTTTLPAGPACPACYGGTWQAVATITLITPPVRCGELETSVGQPRIIAPIVFSPDGTITLPPRDCEGCAGRVDASGDFTINLPGDAPGQGTCPAGLITGRCTSLSSCPGAGAQGGVIFNFVMTRVGP